MRKLLYLAGFVLLVWSLAACNRTPEPKERLQEYVKLWNEQKFDQMYKKYLSEDVKERVKKEEYADRYQTIYDDLEIENLKVSLAEPKEQPEQQEKRAEFPVKVEMDTSAGPIRFEKKAVLKREETEKGENWFVDWDASYIFPEMEEGDKIWLETLEGTRGQIFDRHGNSLAINGNGYRAGVKAGEINHQPAVKKRLAELLGITPDFIDEQLQQSWVQPGYFVPLKTLSRDQREKIAQVQEIPEATLEEIQIREYPYKEALGHLTGYIGRITGEELKKLKRKGYSAEDQIGKRGLEQLLEEQLREEDGKRIWIEKEKAEPVMLAETPAKNGKDVKVAIDAELQKIIYQQLQGAPGTAAAVEPKTGEVLALASSPAFDPNEFVLGVSSSRYQQLESDPKKPLLNRFAATYSPGSTIKPLTAAIALKAKVIEPEQTRDIQGLRWQKDASWGNYRVTRVKDIGHPVSLQDALVHSDNIYFAQTALELGGEQLANGMKAFGFGEKLPFAYPIRSSQISNSGTLEEELLLSDTGYGQGEVLSSMLHLASAYSAIVNNGTMMKPQLSAGKKPEVWKKDLMSPADAKTLQRDLRLVVQKGTAQTADTPGLALAGKTGTAELKKTQGTKGKENGLFVAYDQNSPAFVLAFMIEGVNGQGGTRASLEAVQRTFSEWRKAQ
ncbi:penicillin-binding transpeptidase domain-containing protein [Bacillus xiapuensis]|uniref:penicillin-binding transpeptidase domain-containing protein n=1 Tax=Bacillus xiapuensis TaxID=2014075 RepID=UPI000C235A92|nr:penicillin-binding transpeptidase domain-containing protein [Bacillus xiapuensis]